jgi:hypothetical protein
MRPIRWRTAPLNAPSSWPNSSLSRAGGQGGAVDGDELAVATAAPGVQGAGGQLLADPGLALQQHIDIGAGQLAQGGAQALHHRGLADQRPVALGLGGEGAQLAVLQHQPALLQRPSHAGDQALGRIGLGHEVVDAVVHGLDGLGHVGVAGDQDDRQVGDPVPSSGGTAGGHPCAACGCR